MMTRAMTHSPTSPFWDRAARKYAARPIGNMEAYEQSLDRVRAYLSKTDTVLEMGCGTASTAILLAPHVGHITASDISAEMVEIGREKVWNDSIRNVSNVQGSIGDEGLTGLYDTILAFNLLHLVPDLEGNPWTSALTIAQGWAFHLENPLPEVLELVSAPRAYGPACGWQSATRKLAKPRPAGTADRLGWL